MNIGGFIGKKKLRTTALKLAQQNSTCLLTIKSFTSTCPYLELLKLRFYMGKLY